MRATPLILSLALATVIGVTLATQGESQGTGGAQPGAWAQGRTPWGDPDLQGVWRYEAAIPLERPARFEGRESLTDQERRILELLAEGMTNRQIAAAVFLSDKTVKNYVSSILSKLNLQRRAQAAAFVAKHKPGTGF